MKKQFLLVIAAVTNLSATAYARNVEPEIVNVEFHTMYVPNGFDTNDQVQIVAEGTFSNTCYKPARPKIRVNHESKQIAVYARAFKYEGICSQVLVPYQQTIDVGMLKSGKYEIVQGKRGLGEVSIKVTTSPEADDYLYAPIRQAYLSNPNGKTVVRINGEFATDCQKFNRVLTSIEKNVIVIQPITSMEEREGCAMGYFPFETIVEVPKVNPGRYLLHVRSLNAQAVNSLVDVL